ncbi:hypothetical protein [Desulfitobacterium hafniense]|uniref:hypothetical protein n=1 Tax=Desulfitobacterium hafniense TaxID=49338 RepID=UPI0003765073|nr:hypothetical protein [Desulfitobacterium hafniense]
MRVIMKPIEMIAKFKDGNPTPARFSYNGRTIDVEQIIERRAEILAGNPMKIYSCQSEIDGKLKRYELKFELKTCRWFLYKM